MATQRTHIQVDLEASSLASHFHYNTCFSGHRGLKTLDAVSQLSGIHSNPFMMGPEWLGSEAGGKCELDYLCCLGILLFHGAKAFQMALNEPQVTT